MSLLDWFRTRSAPPPPPLDVPERGPHSDTDDEQYPAPSYEPHVKIDAIEGVAFAIEYADSMGEVSSRRVIASCVSEMSSASFIYLDGWCLLRNDWRRFRSDRILKLSIPPSWSNVGDPTFFLREFLPENNVAPTSSTSRLSPKIVCRDGLAVLLYVARSDSDAVLASEMEAVKHYVVAALNRAGLQAEPSVVVDVLRYANTLYPTARSMGRYLERLERDSDALDILVPYLTKLIKADGVYSEQEQQAVSTLLKAIDRARDRITREESEDSPATAPRAALTEEALGSFIALDLETANSDVSSICSIGLVHFRAGQVIKQLKIPVNPECHFDPMNISIHGIRPEDVTSARTMRDVFPVISAALTNVVVVHHTHFDRSALSQSAAKLEFPELSCRWLDSAAVARRAWKRFSRRGYGLKNLATEFAIEFNHHDACEDARAAGLVLIRAMNDSGLCLDDWYERINRELDSEEFDEEVTALPEASEGLTSEASRISDLVSAVTVAKRERRLDDARILLVDEIERQEAVSRSTDSGVAPWYYEQLAIVYRKQRRAEDELAILERYDRQIKAPGSRPAILKTRLEKVRASRTKARD